MKKCKQISQISWINNKEINHLKRSKWVWRIWLNECDDYVIWDHLVFNNWKELWVKFMFTKKPLNAISDPHSITDLSNNKLFSGPMHVCVRACVCACVVVCGCACVCVFISFHRKGFSRLKKTINEVPEVKVSNCMLRRYFFVNYLCRHVIDNHCRNLQASNWAKECQLNREEPGEVKDN